MDKEALKQYLIDNPDIVEEFLVSCDFYGVKYYESSSQWRMGIEEGSSTSSIRLSSKDLSYKDYKFSDNGDIFSLIMLKKNINFGTALQYIASKTKFIDKEVTITKCELPYCGYYRNFKKYEESFESLEVYDKILIEEYPKTISKLFLKDGISMETQEKWDIRYCSESHRVVIPCYEGDNLIGAIGRYNCKDVDKDIPKYLPIIRYNKSSYLYGLTENEKYIKDSTVFIVESEKTVLTCDSIGINNVVAIGGNSISNIHKNKLLKSSPKDIILILDKGLGYDKAKFLGLDSKEDVDKYLKSVIIKEAEKLINPFSRVYILDCNNIDSIPDKENIFDILNNKEEILKLIEDKKEEVNGK